MGKTMVPVRDPLWFWSNRVEKIVTLDTPCWLWQGKRTTKGYGSVSVWVPKPDAPARDLKTNPHRARAGTSKASWFFVHRMALYLTLLAEDRLAEWSDDVLVTHRCDTPLCFNPAHLTQGTYEMNARESQERGGAHVRKITGSERPYRPERKRGAANPRSKLTEDDVRAIRTLRAADPKRWTQRKLAASFSVSSSAVAQILEGRAWAWVE